MVKQITLYGRHSTSNAFISARASRSLPNLFYIGPARSGSTTFFNYCRMTEDIFVPNLKETNFLSCFDTRFSGPGEVKIFHSGIDFSNLYTGVQQHCAITTSISDYIALFDKYNNERWVADISPSYSFYFERFMRNIHSIASDPSIIFLPRDPVDRAISNYKSLHFRKTPETIIETYSYEFSRSKRGWEFYWSISRQGQYSHIIRGIKESSINSLIDTYERVYRDQFGGAIAEFLGTDPPPAPERANRTGGAKFVELLDVGDLILDIGEPTEAYLDEIEHDRSARCSITIDDNGKWDTELSDRTILNLARPFVSDVMELMRMPGLARSVSSWSTYIQMKRLKLLR